MNSNNKYPKKAGIYKLTCVTNGKIYIGKSVNIHKRLISHKCCEKKSKGVSYFQNAIIKYSWNSFAVEILEIFEDFDKLKDNISLLERESYYIDLYNSTDRDIGYNILSFSNDWTGIKLSDEHKANIGKANKGRIISEEMRKRISQTKLRVLHSEDTKNKMRKPKSEEHQAKCRIAKLGKRMSEEHKERNRQIRLAKKLDSVS